MNALAKFTFTAALIAGLPFSVHAASDTPASTTAAAQAQNPWSEGEIRKIDKDAKKITIKHGEIKNLRMPPMTMVFYVQDATLLNNVKQGDKIHFVAEKVGGQFTVTQMETPK